MKLTGSKYQKNQGKQMTCSRNKFSINCIQQNPRWIIIIKDPSGNFLLYIGNYLR